MANNKRGAVLCPECRKLVNADADACPHCNFKRPGSPIKRLTVGMNDGDLIVKRIIQLNIALYLITLFLNPNGAGMGGNPLRFLSPSTESLLLTGATGGYPIDSLGRWWSLFSASWLHGGILHIGLNMMALRQIAPLVCREYGTHRMVAIYLLSGAFGFLLSYVAGVKLTIGASASICGLVGAAFHYGRKRGGDYGTAVFKHTGGWALSIFLFGLVVPGIDNWAHGGGLIAGMGLGFLLGYREIRRESYLHKLTAMVSMAVSALVLVLAVFSAFIHRFGGML